MMQNKMIIAGDIHMDFGVLNRMIARQRPALVLVAGDFGYWPAHAAIVNRLNLEYGIDNKTKIPRPIPGCKIHWCDGNHEDHKALLARTTDELWPNVFYQPRGSTLTLPDGRVVLFMGGADSHDKEYRTKDIDWFSEELITNEDMDRLPDCKIDIVISHTCPSEFLPGVIDYDFNARVCDPCRTALSMILERYSPSLWYFGHWHRYSTGYTNKCRWTALDHTAGLRPWWEVLKE